MSEFSFVKDLIKAKEGMVRKRVGDAETNKIHHRFFSYLKLCFRGFTRYYKPFIIKSISVYKKCSSFYISTEVELKVSTFVRIVTYTFTDLDGGGFGSSSKKLVLLGLTRGQAKSTWCYFSTLVRRPIGKSPAICINDK